LPYVIDYALSGREAQRKRIMRSVATNTLPQEMSERSGDVFPAKSFFEYFFCSQKKY